MFKRSFNIWIRMRIQELNADQWTFATNLNLSPGDFLLVKSKTSTPSLPSFLGLGRHWHILVFRAKRVVSRQECCFAML